MTQVKLLVVDDDELFRKAIRKELNKMGYSVRTAATSQKALAEVQSFPPDVLLLDIKLPDQNGLQLLSTIKDCDPSIEIIMLTAYGSVDTAVLSMRAGAYHYLVKPAKLEEMDALIQKAYEKKNLKVENRALKEKLQDCSAHETLVTRSRNMKELLELVERVACTDQTVLIQGESGTGKELIARRIHRLSPRSRSPFILVDCASLNKSLLESELFGHEKGAFTGAVSLKHGLLETADTGTLFVDEVGSLEADMQAKFLRMLETQEYRRVGGTTTRKADVRIVAATNTDLSKAVRKDQFREDLFFRLSVIVFLVPPLRERKEDIPLLAEHLLKRAQGSMSPKKLSPRAIEDLCQHNWPGNVRELRNVIERAALLAEGESIEPWDFRMFPSASDDVVDRLVEDDHLISMEELKSRYIRLVLEKMHGHQLKAAEVLGIDPKTIYRNLKGNN